MTRIRSWVECIVFFNSKACDKWVRPTGYTVFVIGVEHIRFALAKEGKTIVAQGYVVMCLPLEELIKLIPIQLELPILIVQHRGEDKEEQDVAVSDREESHVDRDIGEGTKWKIDPWLVPKTGFGLPP